jgi:excisionase family DNA binding protein
MSSDELSEYLTLSEVSKKLKVHPNTLRNWDKDGLLSATRFGVKGVRRYKKEDIEKFIKRGKMAKSE